MPDAPAPTTTTASLRHLPAWFGERFPPSHGVLFFVMYVTALLFGRFLVGDGTLELGWIDLVGFVAAWSFFLMLRVFDEHKDYELDLLNHPDRVLQSGRITLGHLKVLGAIAIAAQLGVSLLLDGGFGNVTLAWLLVIVWSSLMAKEFFCGEWLEERLVLYAVSHMVVMPMALVWMAFMGADSEPLPMTVGLLAALSFCSGAAFEVTRKTKGAEEERDTIRTYSQIWGTTASPLIVLVLLIISTVLQVFLLRLVFDGAVHWGWYVGLVAVLALPAISLHLYRVDPTAKARKMNEGMVSLTMLASYVVLLAAVIVERGIAWI
jgi:hypothetical protein